MPILGQDVLQWAALLSGDPVHVPLVLSEPLVITLLLAEFRGDLLQIHGPSTELNRR